MDTGVILLKKIVWVVVWKQAFFQSPNIAIGAISFALGKGVSPYNNQV